MDFEQITTEVADSVLTITLNRPERLNAWTGRMGLELTEARAARAVAAGRGADLQRRLESRVEAPASEPRDAPELQGAREPI